MARWYDYFAAIYDTSLENLYAPVRAQAIPMLQLTPGATVVDLACGTGQSLPALREAVGPTGTVLGIDASRGMLEHAQKRIDTQGWDNVSVREVSAGDPLPDGVDAVFCALGFTTFDAWEEVFESAWSALPAGGRFGILDAMGSPWTPQKPIVEWMARADLDRRVYEPLEAAASEYRFETLPGSPWVFGGTLFMATGTRSSVEIQPALAPS